MRKFLWRSWSVSVTLAVLMMGGMFGQAEARPFRPGQIPNGGINRCSSCHFNPMGGGGRNAFGQTIERAFLVAPATPANATIDLFTVNWGPDLANLDSDGDGVTNGQELGDPNGAWRVGQPAPGSPRNVSLPGDFQSKPGDLSFTTVANVQVMRNDTPAPAISLTAAMDGTQENPAVTTAGKGTGAFVLDASGLRYRITVDSLSGPMTAAHFHNAAAGTNGGVIQPITFTGNTATGVWAITPAQVAELLAGRIYVNVHTAANPGGEVRGQVTLNAGASFWAALDGSQENPALTVTGTASGSYWLDSKGLNYRITYSGLTGPRTASHFHNAARGTNGGVVRDIPFTGNTATGTWGFDDATQPLTTALLDQLLLGRIYTNLHTAANPGGEIRGQVLMTSGLRFTAMLDGSQENPAVTTSGIGTGAFAWDAYGLQYRVTVSGLSGAISAAHFHNAAAGTNGGVVQATPFTGATSAGNWAITSALLKELLAGKIYFNVHTAANPGGEIRGQLMPASGVAFWAAASGAQENPSVNTSGQGTVYVTWDGNGLTYRATVDGLSGAISASHFHSAFPGTNGGVVLPVTFTGSTTTGTRSAADAAPLLADLWAGKLYFNVHTAANPGGEIRGQVALPKPGLGGLTVDFDRAVAGQQPFSRLVQSTPTATARFPFQYRGTTDANGRTAVNISVTQEPAFRRVGASGYYWARLTDLTTGTVLGMWSGIPLRGGRATDLQLQINGQAAITGPFFGTPLAATKPVAALPTVTVLSGMEPLAPSVSFGSAEKREDGSLDLPVQIGGGNGLFGGDLTLTYDPTLLTFRTGRIGTTEVTATVAQPGEVLLSFEGGNPAGGLVLSFDRRAGDAMGNLKLTGLLYDRDLMPIGDVAAEALLNGASPKDYVLFQNVPNPFNPATTIRYALPEAGRVRLTIYNMLGQQVARLVDVRQEAGAYSITWDARDFASGTYYYRLEAGTFREVKKLVLLK